MQDLLIEEEVLLALRKINRAIDLHSKNNFKKFGLTTPQLVILKEIDKLPQTSLKIIADNVNLSAATVSTILDRMFSRGFITRDKNEIDKRKSKIQITEEGKKILAYAPSLLQEQFLAKFRKLAPWEKSLILSSLQRIAAMMNIDAMDIEFF